MRSDCLFLPQNIIKKVIGKKFVYKFVSFPDILKMDPALVESGRCSEEAVFASEVETEDEGLRNPYLRSGLYSSFTVGSLQQQEHWPVKMEARSDLPDDGSSVIRFKTERGHSSLPPTPSPSSETSGSSRPPSERPQSSPCPSSPPQSPARTRHTCPARQSHSTTQTADPDLSSEPLNLSWGQRGRVRPRSSTAAERRGLASGSPLRSRKPKALEISASSLFLSGSDLVSIALNSPALPSGSVTPAFLTTQVENATASTTHTVY